MALKNGDLIKYSSLIVLVVQNCSLVLCMRYATTGNRAKFLKTICVFFGEIFKLLASLLLVMIQERSIKKGFWVVYDQFFNHWRDALKVLVPAAVYTVQNFLLYVAVENLPAATYMVTYQLKILTTAVFTVLVLKRKLSLQQWLALLILFAGVVVVQYDQKISDDRAKEAAKPSGSVSSTLAPAINPTFASIVPENSTMAEILEQVNVRSKRDTHQDQNSILGFIAVLIACFLSGFAGIYFEKILKGSDVSIWVRNIQLALPSIFFALLFLPL
ncbi:unnamed protein product [Caenorhabditis auriculariae]|uniref:Uncharacterized protein n=1 Tax=Caenorhabditis auriculariae TaxID=2777116 RepID=A0A8S1H804_9PELO|nr:unnamed protein product [Caenorhabditis auriculariae]